jgi:phosphoribosylformylglycinamidine synthase
LNPYRGAQIAVAEAARNLVCSGADPAAVTDCLNFGNPEKPDRFWYFKNCVEGIADACKAFNLPVVSGNVSLYNESPKGPINPTPTIGMIGILPDIEKRTTQYFKDEGDIVILLGETKEEFGGSEYLKVIHDKVAGDAPALDLEKEKALQKTVYDAISHGLLKSAHDCAEGGFAVALAECCISNKDHKTGAIIPHSSFRLPHLREDALLFGESQSRIIVSCTEKNAFKVAALAKENKVLCSIIGKTAGKHLKIDGLIDLPLNELEASWKILKTLV